jgi:prepilin-type N-terminal cleavage/methylation domain-containing protein
MKVRSQAGFTLLELMVAVVVIVVAFFGLLLSLHYGNVLNETARQLQLAHDGARQAMEAVRAYDFAYIYYSFNANTADDPNGPGTAEATLPPLNNTFPQGAGQPPLTAVGDGIGNNFVIDGLRHEPPFFR